MFCLLNCLSSSGCCLSSNVIWLFLAAVAMTVFSMIFGAITCGWLFSWIYKLQPTNIWRKMDGHPGLFFMFGMTFLNFFLAFVYTYVSVCIPFEPLYMKGLIFGLGLYGISALPMILSSYTFINMVSGVAIYWMCTSLVQALAKGLIIAFIYGK